MNNKITQLDFENLTDNQRLLWASDADQTELFEILETSLKGKNEEQIEDAREKFGENKVIYKKKKGIIRELIDAFINPFTIVLIVLAIVSTVTDIFLAQPGDRDFAAVIIITTMVLISGTLKFVQERRSGEAAEKLTDMIENTTAVLRIDMGRKEIPIDEVVVGDIIHISAGDMIPADMRILNSKDLFLSQASLTGESEPVEKFSDNEAEGNNVLYKNNLVFMGTSVVSGSARGVVIGVGNDTIFGSIAEELEEPPEATSFEKGVNSVSWVLIRFMLIMVPIVFFVNGFTKGDWLHAGLFAISIAVGLTPEMLPMIVTAGLSKGSLEMAKEEVIIKNLNSIQNLGSMDILCTDKTGTLTENKVVLQYHLNLDGEEDTRVLRHGFLNSYFQTGLKNLIDIAIINKTMELQEDENLKDLSTRYEKIDEIPFDFSRRRMSVVVQDKTGKTQMITKGAIEEMLEVSSFLDINGEVVPLTDEMKETVMDSVRKLNEDGMRVLGVSQKTNHRPVGAFSTEDESVMVLIGYLAFLDPPKASAVDAIQALKENEVTVKILTGDNSEVTRAVCSQLGLEVQNMYTGEEIEVMTDDEIKEIADEVTVFAKLSPEQKARIVRALRAKGHSVGYMGDGINDAPAMKASDVGISVHDAVDIAKEAADVILLKKDLMVLEEGILEGRKTYGNMIKYIKMTASSNFGNVFSVLLASAFLPFMPMESMHLLLLNLIYDISCTAIPWDHMDAEFLKKPRDWDASSISKFMIYFGPTSSIFDIITYLFLYFVLCPQFTGGMLYHQLTDPAMKALYIAVFQSGWFVESMWTQTLVIHTLRSPKIPFLQSHSSFPVMSLTTMGIVILTLIPFTGLGKEIGLHPLNATFFIFLGVVVIAYMALVQVMKNYYVKREGELL